MISADFLAELALRLEQGDSVRTICRDRGEHMRTVYEAQRNSNPINVLIRVARARGVVHVLADLKKRKRAARAKGKAGQREYQSLCNAQRLLERQWERLLARLEVRP